MPNFQAFKFTQLIKTCLIKLPNTYELDILSATISVWCILKGRSSEENAEVLTDAKKTLFSGTFAVNKCNTVVSGIGAALCSVQQWHSNLICQGGRVQNGYLARIPPC